MSTSDPVPVVDISPFLDGSPDGKRAVARSIAAACEESGFFCITGHGVDEALIARTRQAAEHFFDQPLEQKRKVLRAEDRIGCGYYPVADRSLAHTLGVKTPPDLQEAWVMAPPDTPDDPYYHGETARYFFGTNHWPEGMPGFRETMSEYFRTLTGLGKRMMGLFALALELEEDYFADKIDRAAGGLRLLHYPPQSVAAEPGQFRAGAHTDYGTMTILRGDDVPGTLQIKHPSAGWIDIRPPANAYVCNLGDAMARWTGGRWASTLHRVGNPPSPEGSKGRISLVFFNQPNYDVVLGGIDGTSDGAVTLAEHYIEKIHRAVSSVPPAA